MSLYRAMLAVVLGLGLSLGIMIVDSREPARGTMNEPVEIIDPLVIERTDPHDPSNATVYVP